MPLNAGLVIPRGSASDLIGRVAQAERRGIATAWTTVGGLGADPVTALAAVGAATDRIGLGTAVTPTYPRHPITLAAQVIAINDLAPGRLRLGVGPSHKPIIEGAYGLPMGKPLAHLREYVTILRMLLWRGRLTSPATTSRSRLLAGGRAGAEDPHPHLGAAPECLSSRRRDRRRGYFLGDAGRLPDADRVAPTAGRGGGDGPGAPALDRTRAGHRLDRSCRGAGGVPAQFPHYPRLPFYAAMFAEAGYPITAAGEMTDELVESLAVSGGPEEIRDRLEAIRARGIDELMISHVVVADEEAELAALSEILAGE